MADTKEFDVIRIARSDGADSGLGYWPLPTPATTSIKKTGKETPSSEKAPRTKPQMMRLSQDDPRFVEWRVKLGILLKQELSPNPDEGNSWYVQFPQGYWLYEKSKHLWVSGYPIKAKLFKSPQEFALHLIWLLSSSKEYKDCCCVHCNLPNLTKLSAALDDTPTLMSSEPARPEKPTPKVSPVPLPPIPGQPALKQTVATTRPHAVQSHPSLAPRPSDVTKPEPLTVASSTQMQPQQRQPIVWALQASLLFRIGELVWYQTGNTWRLGIVAGQGPGGHDILPLGYVTVPQPPMKKTDADMRPFQAFSVPPVSIPELNGKIFDEIPWDAMFQSAGAESGQRDVIVLDASKLAASKVDYSFSVFSPMSKDAQAKTTTYYGCFLGAERLEIGDSLRVKALPSDFNTSTDYLVLGLRYIFTAADFPGAVFFRGHLYQPAQSSTSHSSLVPENDLPVALRDDTTWRNRVNPTRHGHGWVLVKEDTVLKEQSIRGRYYPTHRLMPILSPVEFQAAVAAQTADDQYPYLNNRMDGAGRYLGQRKNRLQTLGTSVLHHGPLSLESYVREY